MDLHFKNSCDILIKLCLKEAHFVRLHIMKVEKFQKTFELRMQNAMEKGHFDAGIYIKKR